MNDQELYLLLKQTGNSLQAIFDYFKLKNRVLYNSSTGFSINSKTQIPNIHKYKTFYIYENTTNHMPVFCLNDNGNFKGSGQVNDTDMKLSANSQWILAVEGVIITDYLTVTAGHSMGHTVNQGHSKRYTISNIKRIIGIDPIIPDSLSNIIGGGYCLTKFLREGCIDYVQSLKESFHRYKKTKVFETNKEMGEDRRRLWTHIIQCEQIQRIAFSNIFRRSQYRYFYSCNNINRRRAHAFCRDVQFRNLCGDKQNSHVGIPTTNWLHSRINSLRQIKEMGWCV